VKYLTKDSLNFYLRGARSRRRLCGVQKVLLALGILGIVSATPVSAAELVSVNAAGTDSGSGESYGSVISADGRFVAFSSEADNLVATDTNGMRDAFVRDLESGTTTLVSFNNAGTNSGNGDSRPSAISPDGRFVAFSSEADDLVATDTNGASDVFVRDLQLGTTTLVSVNLAGTDSAPVGTLGYGSYSPVITPDGRFVAFVSYAFVHTDASGDGDVFIRDLDSGTTTLVSVNIHGTGQGECILRAITDDGQFVAFECFGSNLVDKDTNVNWDVFVRDLDSGTTTLVSVNKDGTGSGLGGDSEYSSMSSDGRFVAFSSKAIDLVATDTNSTTSDVFVRDLQLGNTILVSVNDAGTDSGNGKSYNHEITADGQFVAFSSEADDLVATDTNGTRDVFVRDLTRGTTTLVSVNEAGIDSGNAFSGYPTISANGRFVAFESNADDLVAMDTNGMSDVFVRNLKNGTTTLVSVKQDGTDSGNGRSDDVAITPNGRVVAFNSHADNLATKDTNGERDVFAFEVYKAPKGCNCTAPGAIKGTAGRDFIYGTKGADIICGLGGNDFIAGKGGDDCIDGGSGNDWIYGGRGNDRIFGRSGNDVVYGHRGSDQINGNKGKDYLFGGRGDDKIDGGEGYDRIFCGPGTDEGIGEYVRGCEH
jgi:Tol biopolymer transport system component